MRERFFEGEKTNDKKAIERELSDHGINDPKDWRKALDLETSLEGEEGGLKVGAKEKESEKSPEQPPELGNFAKILQYVEGSRTADRSKIEAFASTKDGLVPFQFNFNYITPATSFVPLLG